MRSLEEEEVFDDVILGWEAAAEREGESRSNISRRVADHVKSSRARCAPDTDPPSSDHPHRAARQTSSAPCSRPQTAPAPWPPPSPSTASAAWLITGLPTPLSSTSFPASWRTPSSKRTPPEKRLRSCAPRSATSSAAPHPRPAQPRLAQRRAPGGVVDRRLRARWGRARDAPPPRPAERPLPPRRGSRAATATATAKEDSSSLRQGTQRHTQLRLQKHSWRRGIPRTEDTLTARTPMRVRPLLRCGAPYGACYTQRRRGGWLATLPVSPLPTPRPSASSRLIAREKRLCCFVALQSTTQPQWSRCVAHPAAALGNSLAGGVASSHCAAHSRT